jgi:hypothetical protein
VAAVAVCADAHTPSVSNRLYVALNQYYYHYSELFDEKTLSMLGNHEIRGEPKSDEYGATTMMSLSGTLFSRGHPLYASAFFEMGGGTHTYNGATQETVVEGNDTIFIATPITVKKNNEFTAWGLFAGPYFFLNNLFYGLQTGIEYQYWKRKLFSMKEKYRWWYVPFIAQTEYQLTPAVSIGCNCTFRLMVSGTMEIDFGQESMMDYMEIPVLSLGKRHGFTIELPLRTALTNIFGLEFKPWLELRPSGISNVDTMRLYDGIEERKAPFLEPASESYSIGVSISLVISDLFSRPKVQRPDRR